MLNLFLTSVVESAVRKQKAEQVLVCSRFPVCVSCVWTNCDLYFSVSVSLFDVNLEAEALSSLPLVAQCVFGPLQRLSAASVPVFQIKSKINWCSLHRRPGFISGSRVWLQEAARAHDELYLQRLRSQSWEVLMGRFSFFFFSGDTFFSQVSLSCVYDYEEKKMIYAWNQKYFLTFCGTGWKRNSGEFCWK